MGKITIQFELSLRNVISIVLIFVLVQWICIIIPTIFKTHWIPQMLGQQKLLMTLNAEDDFKTKKSNMLAQGNVYSQVHQVNYTGNMFEFHNRKKEAKIVGEDNNVNNIQFDKGTEKNTNRAEKVNIHSKNEASKFIDRNVDDLNFSPKGGTEKSNHNYGNRVGHNFGDVTIKENNIQDTNRTVKVIHHDKLVIVHSPRETKKNIDFTFLQKAETKKSSHNYENSKGHIFADNVKNSYNIQTKKGTTQFIDRDVNVNFRGKSNIDFNLNQKRETEKLAPGYEKSKGDKSSNENIISDSNNSVNVIDNVEENAQETTKMTPSRGINDETCLSCKKFNYKPTLNIMRCRNMSSDNNLQMLFLIMGPPENFERRMAIRQSYLSKIKPKPIDYAFVVGKSENKKTEERVLGEMFKFGDILKFDFIDSYENLTIKSISAFKWASGNCQQANYVMKLNDDVWVNTDILLSASKTTPFIKYIGGYCYNGAAPVREVTDKHFISKEEYPDESFPPYCNGPSYIMTTETVQAISVIASHVPYVHIEDVFIGICLQRLNYSVTHNRRFHRPEGDRHPCYYKSSDVFTVPGIPLDYFGYIWKVTCTPSQKYESQIGRRVVQDMMFNLTDFSDRKTCNKCFNFRFPTLLENNICENNNTSDIEVFLLIFTRPDNIQTRLTIRQTYLSPFNNFNSSLRHVFVVGNSKESIVNQMIDTENKVFRDMLKFDFDDRYRNLTIKTLNGLNWVSSNCKNAKYILKIDDDVWLNSKNLISKLHTKGLQIESIGGNCIFDGKPIRDRESKYYISEHFYPYFDFPPFCVGPAYILRQDVVQNIVKMAPDVPFFPLEDVFVGMCLYYLNYSVTSVSSFGAYSSYQFPCWFKSNSVLTYHSMSSNFMKEIWAQNCSDFSQEVAKRAIFSHVDTPKIITFRRNIRNGQTSAHKRLIHSQNAQASAIDSQSTRVDFYQKIRTNGQKNINANNIDKTNRRRIDDIIHNYKKKKFRPRVFYNFKKNRWGVMYFIT